MKNIIVSIVRRKKQKVINNRKLEHTKLCMIKNKEIELNSNLGRIIKLNRFNFDVHQLHILRQQNRRNIQRNLDLQR